MAKHIDVEKKIKELQAKCVACTDYENCTNCHIDKIITELKNTRPADVVKVKHGAWKKETKFIITDDPDDDGYWRTIYVCSECEREEWRKEPYCHCGAKMDGGKQ